MTEAVGIEGGALGIGLFAVRLVLGLGIAAHGAQKLFGWFGGHGGLAGTGELFESLGFRPGVFWAGLAGLGEFGGGLLLAIGLMGPVGPALVVATMVVAMLTAHRGKGFFATGSGIELPLVYAAGVGGLAVVGHGAYALDNWLGLAGLWTPAIGWMALAAAVATGYVVAVGRGESSAPPAE